MNIQKARAARKRAPLPWRSGIESRIIEQLVWQWFLEARGWGLEAGAKNSGQRTVNGGQRENQQLIPHTAAFVHVPLSRQTGRPIPFDCAQGKRNDKLHRPWAKVRVARFLGVSHTWVNKLVKKFEADPERMRRKMRAFAPASIDKLERAREETRWEREHGRLREPIRYRRVKVVLYGKKRKVMVPTKAVMSDKWPFDCAKDKRVASQQRGVIRNSTAGPQGEVLRLRESRSAQDDTKYAGQRDAASRALPSSGQAGAALRSSGQASSAPTMGTTAVAYREVPEWARGLLLPGDPGTASMRTSPGRTPRPVPFAFRRRR